MNECSNKKVSQFVLDQLDIVVGPQNRILVVGGSSNHSNKVKMVAAAVARTRGISMSRRHLFVLVR